MMPAPRAISCRVLELQSRTPATLEAMGVACLRGDRPEDIVPLQERRDHDGIQVPDGDRGIAVAVLREGLPSADRKWQSKFNRGIALDLRRAWLLPAAC
jgi:hypothetical protein